MRTKSGFVLLCAGLILFTCFVTGPINAQTAVFTGVTLSGDQEPGWYDYFGGHIAANREWLMVGAPGEDIDLDGDGMDGTQGDWDVGAVYVYRRTENGPVFHQKISGEGNNKTLVYVGDRFGSGITLLGDWMFVCAANDNDFPGLTDPLQGQVGPDPFSFAGKIYVFHYNAETVSWELTQKLTSDEPKSAGGFGSRTLANHVELFSFGEAADDPTIALVGENGNAVWYGFPSNLHVFKRKANETQWNRVQIVYPPNGVAQSPFADSVEGIGQFALVTQNENNGELDPGVVQVYRINPNGIVEFNGEPRPIQTLEVPGGDLDIGECVHAHFGYGMSASNGIAAIGNPCNDTAAVNAGAVHVYSVDNSGNNDPLTLVQTLPNPTASPDSFFGRNLWPGKQSVTTDGDVILVGTAMLPTALSGQQNVEMFARDSSGEFFNIDSIPSPAPGIFGFETYGQSVTLLGDGELAISQMTDGVNDTNNGRVFIFGLQGVE